MPEGKKVPKSRHLVWYREVSANARGERPGKGRCEEQGRIGSDMRVTLCAETKRIGAGCTMEGAE